MSSLQVSVRYREKTVLITENSVVWRHDLGLPVESKSRNQKVLNIVVYPARKGVVLHPLCDDGLVLDGTTYTLGATYCMRPNDDNPKKVRVQIGENIIDIVAEYTTH